MNFKSDMTMMFVIHDALRRDLERIARITARMDDDPQRMLRASLGWELFKSYLHIHHLAEDEMAWDVMRPLLIDRPGELALLDAMEAEHAAIDPMLNAVDAALNDRDHGAQRLGDLVDNLVTGLTRHLKHEESEGLALIDATLDEQQFKRVGDRQAELIGADASRYLPWLLDEIAPAKVAAILSRIPERFRIAYQDQWQPAFDGLTLWPNAARHVGS